MSSLSDKADEEDEDSSAWWKNAKLTPNLRRFLDQCEDRRLRKELPKELPCVIREYFRDGTWHSTEKTISGIRRALLYRRINKRLREVIRSGLNATVRRKILKRQRGGYIISHRRFADYNDAELETRILRAIGRAQVKRSDAPTLLARHLGFKITTPAIKQNTERLIRRLIRKGSLKKEGKDGVRRV